MGARAQRTIAPLKAHQFAVLTQQCLRQTLPGQRFDGASLQGLQTSSAALLRYSRLALQIGQTRISSRRASIEFLQNCTEQGCAVVRWLNRRRNRQHPSLTQIYRGAFYRIFLGHQQHAIPREG